MRQNTIYERTRTYHHGRSHAARVFEFVAPGGLDEPRNLLPRVRLPGDFVWVDHDALEKFAEAAELLFV
jgi:hypothetical protein